MHRCESPSWRGPATSAATQLCVPKLGGEGYEMDAAITSVVDRRATQERATGNEFGRRMAATRPRARRAARAQHNAKCACMRMRRRARMTTRGSRMADCPTHFSRPHQLLAVERDHHDASLRPHYGEVPQYSLGVDLHLQPLLVAQVKGTDETHLNAQVGSLRSWQAAHSAVHEFLERALAQLVRIVLLHVLDVLADRVPQMLLYQLDVDEL
mmetsp:Transcript_91195/g.263107  ORF Transcript_91195/g.263107 Transcript_91195/m.263107 type:complete len:212 (+) Transcript_91195:99-734(+)